MTEHAQALHALYANGWTQVAIAQALDTTPRTLQRWQAGDPPATYYGPTLAALQALGKRRRK